MTGAQIERAKAKQRGRSTRATLSNEDYDIFKDMLYHLTTDRSSIKQAMGFALDNTEAYEEVVNILKESLMVPSTPPPAKVARLYLVSDILHNSGAAVKNASLYRTALQSCLPEVFERLNEWLRGISGRMTAGQVEERVSKLIALWYDWAIFPTMFINGLEAIFNQTEGDVARYSELSPSDPSVLEDKEGLRRKAKFSGLNITLPQSGRGKMEESDFVDSLTLYRKLTYVTDFVARKEAQTLEGDDEGMNSIFKAMEDAATGGTGSVGRSVVVDCDDDDVDGVPIDDDIDGQPIPEYDDDIDGVPLDDDIDGVPIDDDIDGAPMDDCSSNEPSDDESPRVISIDEPALIPSSRDEADRVRMREVEVAVEKLRDELEGEIEEGRKRYSDSEVEDLLNQKRQELLSASIRNTSSGDTEQVSTQDDSKGGQG